MQTKNLLIFITLVMISCAQSNETSTPSQSVNGPLFSKINSNHSNIEFVNEAKGEGNTGLINYDYLYNGGGVATGDINNDGLVDVIFSGNSVSNRIYLNKGDFIFEDISESSGIQNEFWTTGVTLIDINQDGWLDIYFCNSGPFPTGEKTANQLYLNNRNNTFKEVAAAYGIDDTGRSTHASFFDYDTDGDLDLFVLNHSLRNRGRSAEQWLYSTDALPDKIKSRESCSIYRNNGNNKFEDISESAGVNQVGFGLGHVIRDFNEDGLLDIYVANDFFIPDFLYINKGNGKFKDQIKDYLKHTAFYSMGTDAADINNDGDFDLITLDMTPSDHVRNKTMMASMNIDNFNYLIKAKQYIHQYMFNSLFINSGKGHLNEIGQMLGVAQTGWSWTPLLNDFDNNGYKDLFIANGYRKDILNNDWKNELAEIQKTKGNKFTAKDYYKHLESAKETAIPNLLYFNSGNLDFKMASVDSGLDEPSFSNGAAYADFDNDGDLDLVVNNFVKEAFLYKNNSRGKKSTNFIRVRLLDKTHKGAEQHAKLCIYYRDQLQCNIYNSARGFQSNTELISHFGLGDITQIDSLVVAWLDGTNQIVQNPKVNTVIELSKTGKKVNTSNQSTENNFFTDITLTTLTPQFKHVENTHNEYSKEVLLPHSQSTEGPALAVGDLNGDNLDDFFVGSSTGSSSKVYLQNADGRFIEKDNPDIAAESVFEDVGAQLADIDKDGDLDIFVTSGGGSEFLNAEDHFFTDSSEFFYDRLYANDGSGTFTKVKIPKINSSTKSVLITDLNQDGLDEMIVGGRTQPGKYPSSPKSYILSTTRKGILDVTDQLCKELGSIGMVTDVTTADLNSDGLTDLIIVGEWMPITILINTPDGLINKTSEYQLQNTAGWWSHINAGDFDNDGDQDFIVGNIGQNNKFHPSESKPLYLNANDFDDNGSIDIVLNKVYKGKRVPTRGKECSTEQMPFLSEKFKSYEQFANASLNEIYTSEKLDNSIKLKANMFESIYLENEGGRFNIKPLPRHAQISPINGSITIDINHDGNLDLVVGGNKYNTEAETQRYDAGSGCILLGDGKGGFTPIWKPEDTGLQLTKDVRDLELIHIGKDKSPALLVANNNDLLQLYKLN